MKNRYLPDGSGDKRQWYNRYAVDDLPLDDPAISNRIPVNADK